MAHSWGNDSVVREEGHPCIEGGCSVVFTCTVEDGYCEGGGQRCGDHLTDDLANLSEEQAERLMDRWDAESLEEYRLP
mgnify:CR=1 FL=1